MKYYLASDGQPQGPYTVDELRQRNILPDSLVWNEAMKDWTPAGQVPELAAALFGTIPPIGPMTNANPMPGTAQSNTCNQVCPKTWLAESILATLFCCLPFGIVGIVKASQVESRFRGGDYNGALQSSKDAAKWTKWSVITAGIIYVIYGISIVVTALFAN